MEKGIKCSFEDGEETLLCYIIANKEKFGYVKVIPFSCGSCDMLGFKKDGIFEYVEIEWASWKYKSHKHHPKYGIYRYNADRIIALYGRAREVDGVPVTYVDIDDYNEYLKPPKEAQERLGCCYVPQPPNRETYSKEQNP